MAEALNLKTLRTALESSDATWEMDEENPIVQLDEATRRRMLGFTPPPGAKSLKAAVKADAEQTPITPQSVMAEHNIGIPSKFDQRDINGQNYTTVVKNQGGCGSCVSFAVSAVMETTYQRQTNNPNSSIDLSEAHLFYCHGGEDGRNCSNGWWPDKALEKARDRGVATEDKYPYTGSQQACAVSGGWQNSCAKSLGHTKHSTRSAMKNWIATRGSITGCFIVYQDFFSYRSGVYRHVTGDSAGGHCVEICGYDDSQACWICKNSWGTGWGESGYFRIGYGQCQIDSWFGPYGCNGVTLRTWVRDKRVTGLWTNSSANNAHVFLSGEGWRRLQNDHASTHHAMLAELCGARAGSRRVDALVDGNEIQQLYVL